MAAMLLLTDWQGRNPAGWMLSEKLDGWRMLWTGREFVLRGGGVISAPDSWRAGMPAFPLDGELFAGRGGFYQIQARLRDGWRGLTFQVFDTPAPGPFRQRLRTLRAVGLPAHCRLVRHFRCQGEQHLLEFADAIVEAGGEGAVIRDPKAAYVSGRTWGVQRWVPVAPAVNRRPA